LSVKVLCPQDKTPWIFGNLPESNFFYFPVYALLRSYGIDDRELRTPINILLSRLQSKDVIDAQIPDTSTIEATAESDCAG
jgi:hypothetical protein